MEAIRKLEDQCAKEGGILGMRTDGDQYEPLCIVMEPLEGDAVGLRVGNDHILLKRSQLLAHLQASGLTGG